jgi:S-methylmethionine-dependent homocysteine/selenocysteine methylase
MESPRQSRTTTGRVTLLISKVTVDQPTSDVQLLILDGGRSSELRKVSSSMREERLWKSKTKKKPLMLRTETLW